MTSRLFSAQGKTDRRLLAALCLYPALVSLVAVHLEIATAVTYPLGKVIMLALPILVWRASGKRWRQMLDAAGVKRTNGAPGLISGAALAAIILGGYFAFFRKEMDAQAIADKVTSLGLKDYYWAMAIFVSLSNSFMEEYYWRAFVHEQLSAHIRRRALLCAANGLLFGMHHVFVLTTFVPVAAALPMALGTSVAGTVWSWLRARGYSIFDCYISHLIADVAVMWAGWDMISRLH